MGVGKFYRPNPFPETGLWVVHTDVVGLTVGSSFGGKKGRLTAFAVLVGLALFVAPQPWLNGSTRAEASGATNVAGHFSTGRESTSAAFDGTHAWVFGGRENGKRLADIVRYDPATDEAVTIPLKLPTGREATSAVFLDGSAYVIGGRDNGQRLSAILKFTPDGAGGGSLAPFTVTLPTGREYTAAGTDGESIFVFGGTDGSLLDEIVRIDPSTQERQVMTARLPTPRMLMSTASYGPSIYLFGGYDGARLDSILRYDPAADAIHEVGALPSARADTSAVYAAPYAYVFGGRTTADGRINEIVRYDPASETAMVVDWTFPSERESTSAVSTGDDGEVLVVFGGRNSGHRLDEIVEIEPSAGAPLSLVARTGRERGEIDLSWQAPEEGSLSGPLLGYRVYRGVSSGSGAALAPDLPPTQLEFTDTGLPNSVIRFYTVVAFTAVGEGGHSNEAFAATKRGPPPDLPSPREGTKAVAWGHKAYVFGGYQSPESAVGGAQTDAALLGTGTEQQDAGELALNEIVEYDAESGSVTILGQELPPKCCASAESAGGVIYLFGGDGGEERCCEEDEATGLLDDALQVASIDEDERIFRFDPATGELVLLGATLPTALCCNEAIFDGNVIWLFGGSEEERCCEDEREGLAPGDPLSDILIFDPVTETVQDSGYELPFGNCCFGGEYADGFVYLFGGSNDAEERCCGESDAAVGLTNDEIVKFDVGTGEVTVLGTTLPLPKCCFSTASDGLGTIYLFGGEGDEERCCEDESTATSAAGLGGVQYDDIYAFNVATETIRVLDDKLPSARSDTSAVWNGQRAFVFGGDVDGTSTQHVFGFEPLAPQAANAEAGPGRGEITLDWSAPADPSQVSLPGAVYRIHIATSGGEVVVDVPTNSTQYLDAGLGDAETRTYRVSVVTNNDESPESLETTATTFAGPDAPGDLAAETDLGTITLTWSAPDDGGTSLLYYTVYRHTDLDPDVHTFPVPADQTSYVDEDCTFPAVQCIYTVTATNLVGESGHSNEASGIGTALPGESTAGSSLLGKSGVGDGTNRFAAPRPAAMVG